MRNLSEKYLAQVLAAHEIDSEVEEDVRNLMIVRYALQLLKEKQVELQSSKEALLYRELYPELEFQTKCTTYYHASNEGTCGFIQNVVGMLYPKVTYPRNKPNWLEMAYCFDRHIADWEKHTGCDGYPVPSPSGDFENDVERRDAAHVWYDKYLITKENMFQADPYGLLRWELIYWALEKANGELNELPIPEI